MKKIGFLLLFPQILFASETSIPTEMIINQSINLGLVFILLFFLLKNKVVQHFKDRNATYTEFLERAEKARLEAEAQKKEFQEKLMQLKSSQEEVATQARAEAEELKSRLLKEANELSEKVSRDAQQTAQYELERAKEKLREHLLNQSVSAAAQVLKEKVGEPEQKRLRSEFVDKIQVVH